MAPKFPLFTKKNDLKLLRFYGEVIYLGKTLPVLVATVSRQALDIWYETNTNQPAGAQVLH